jgi:hypothetical protein
MNSLPGNRRDPESDSLRKKLGNLFQDVQQKAAAARAKSVQHGIFDRPRTGLHTGAGPSQEPVRF